MAGDRGFSTPMMENQMEIRMDNETQIGFRVWG